MVESEGNGRMCLTLPQTLITVMGIEKVIPSWRDLGVFLQLLPRSSTGRADEPVHVDVDRGDARATGRRSSTWCCWTTGGRPRSPTRPAAQALHCIRCSACLNVCPVYERTGGHAYGSVYPGPIGAVLSPLLTGVEDNASLPYASSLCGACYDACPVKINIPSLLVYLRARHVEEYRAGHRVPSPEAVTMAAASWVMADPRRYAAAQRAGPVRACAGRARPDPRAAAAAVGLDQGPRRARSPGQTFRQWWRESGRDRS